MMKIQNDVSLAAHSTMRLGGKAKHLVTVTDRHELASAAEWAQKQQLQLMVIGDGSNIVWGDKGFDGLVVVNRIAGFALQPEGKEFSYATIGAGENWDKVVARTVEAGLHGIEALSLIPGTAGATPIQNVGAYGQEIADTLVSLEAYDLTHNRLVTISVSDCGFDYRTSRFKTTDKGRFLITQITLRLRRINPRPLYYPAVAEYLRANRVKPVTPLALRQAVIAIRSSKLPDPAKVANNGSFFANPIVSKSFYGGFAKDHPEAPHWPVGTTKVKLSAAWLIEQAGFKNVHDATTGMATWSKQPLVLVNEHAKNTADLLKFRDKIIAKVDAKFSVKLVQEPELVA